MKKNSKPQPKHVLEHFRQDRWQVRLLVFVVDRLAVLCLAALPLLTAARLLKVLN